MLKRWRSLALSVLLPCCMCLMLFLDTLQVNASTLVSNYYSLVSGSSVVSSDVYTTTISFRYVPELTSLTLGSGTYSGSSSGSSSGTYSGSSSGSSSGSYSGSEETANNYDFATLPLNLSDSGTWRGTDPGSYSGSVSGSTSFYWPDYDTSGTISTTITSSDSGTLSGSLSTSDSGTISLSSSSNGSVLLHFHLPVGFFGSTSSAAIYPDKYYVFRPYFTSYSVSSGSVSNVYLSDSQGYVYRASASNNVLAKIVYGSDLLTGTNNTYGQMGFVDFDYFLANTTNSGTASITLNLRNYIGLIKDEYQDSVGTTVISDPTAHEYQSQTLESSQAIEDSVTSETGTGLLATIKNFFGSFFSNIINSFISLFVPSSDYFSTWFENLNNLLSEKLGMLYAPFDFIISILNSVYSADTSEPSIPFPAITWDGTTLVSAQNLKFSEILGDNYSTLQGYVYFGTDTVLLFAFLYLLQRKIALILTGSEANG